MNVRRKRIPSSEYRQWSIEQWCQHVESLDVKTLSQWAYTSRTSYSRAVTLGLQRKVARRLGWLPRLDTGEMERLTDHEFAERFRAKGARCMTDLWKSAQHWCEYLRKQGRLEKVALLLGFGYVQEWHPNDLGYYLERCRQVGDLTAWRYLDKNASEIKAIVTSDASAIRRFQALRHFLHRFEAQHRYAPNAWPQFVELSRLAKSPSKRHVKAQLPRDLDKKIRSIKTTNAHLIPNPNPFLGPVDLREWERFFSPYRL